jgi:hypothetical protein
MIRCICIDDTNRPEDLPLSRWVKKDKQYHINYIYEHLLQGGILGVCLNEIDLLELKTQYSSFKITRFGIHTEDLQKFIELCKDTAELSDINIEELVERQVELVDI